MYCRKNLQCAISWIGLKLVKHCIVLALVSLISQELWTYIFKIKGNPFIMYFYNDRIIQSCEKSCMPFGTLHWLGVTIWSKISDQRNWLCSNLSMLAFCDRLEDDRSGQGSHQLRQLLFAKSTTHGETHFSCLRTQRGQFCCGMFLLLFVTLTGPNLWKKMLTEGYSFRWTLLCTSGLIARVLATQVAIGWVSSWYRCVGPWTYFYIHARTIRMEYLSVVLCQVFYSADMSMNCEFKLKLKSEKWEVKKRLRKCRTSTWRMNQSS